MWREGEVANRYASRSAGSKIGGFGIASYVLGMAGWLVLPLTGAICGILAVVFSRIENGRILKGESSAIGANLATAGLVLGIIEASMGLLYCFIYFFAFMLAGRGG